ncbi:MAG: serine hydrolase [bacterium]|nr:serine hydrolase [bacterium]
MVAMRRLIPVVGLIVLLVLVPTLVIGQTGGVFAEAVGQANLRTAPGTDGTDIIGQIVAGTRYPVIGRSEFYPWVLLANPTNGQPLGWVFNDLVTISGDLNTIPFSTTIVNASGTPPGLPSAATPAPSASAGGNGSATLPPGVTPVSAGSASGGRTDNVTSLAPTQAASFRVTGLVNGEINIRYGPGVEYPRIAGAFAGDRLEVTAYHTQLPWVQVRVAESPNGYGWIALELLQFEGDPYSLPSISQTTFDLPTLTPTASASQASARPGEPVIPVSPSFQALGDRAWQIILDAGFQPELTRLGALYIQDLRTGEAVTYGSSIAFSGTSVNKIAILAELFGRMGGDPTLEEAVDIANTMICSENAATNELLSIIGEGDALSGADRVTEFLQQLGMQNTYIAAPYDTTNGVLTPTAAPRAPIVPTTRADRTRANPDFYNQMTVDEMGWLLDDIYECAVHNRGPLIEDFPGQFTQQECQRMVNVMGSNTVDGLLRAGVPQNILVAHKHGWTSETHTNAALFFTPGGDYIIVIALHQPTWLAFPESLPTMAEVSRLVYNYYNPDAPLAAIRDGYIPDTETCDDYDPALLENLISPFYQLPITPQPTLAGTPIAATATPAPVLSPSAPSASTPAAQSTTPNAVPPTPSLTPTATFPG